MTLQESSLRMFETFYKRPMAVQALQYAADKSNQTEVINTLVGRGFSVRAESDGVLIAEVDLSMLMISPGDYLIEREGQLVARDEEFFQRHYTSYRPY